MKITVIGSSNTDMIIKVPRLPVPGETIIGGRFFTSPGGKGANQAVAAARGGGEVTFITRTGNDMFGKQAAEMYKKEGINVNYIVEDKDAPSGVAEIIVDEKGNNLITVAPGANLNLSIYDVIAAKDVIVNSDILLVQLEIPLKTVEYAVRLARENGVRVILNPAPAQTLSIDLLKTISILTPNEREAEFLTGIKVTDESSAEDAGRILISKGVEKVIVTLGKSGALVLDSGGSEMVSGFKVKVEDTTAAGDVFNGVLAVALGEKKNIYEAVRFANTAAALSVTKLGAQLSAPTREEIQAFI